MDDNLEKALRVFKHYDAQAQTLISKAKFTEILQKQAAIYLKHNFSQSIIEEIWGQAETTSKGEATAFTFAKIYMQAMNILQTRIDVISGLKGLPKKQEQLISQQKKLKQLQFLYEEGFEENSDRINTIRKNIVAIENKITELNNNRQDFQKQLDEMKACLQVQGEKVAAVDKTEYVYSVLEEKNEPSKSTSDLFLIFVVSLTAALLQMLFYSYHESFLALLCYCLVIYWLFLGYYDQNFVKTLMSALTLSIIMDLIYIILELTSQIGSYRYYSQYKGWIYASIVLLSIEIGLRIFLIIKLYIFKDPNSKRQYFILFGHEIELHNRSGKMFNNYRRHD